MGNIDNGSEAQLLPLTNGHEIRFQYVVILRKGNVNNKERKPVGD